MCIRWTMERPLNWKNSIVLVPFPFDDLSTTKVRPALCLTERLGSHDHVVVAFITSQVLGELDPTDIVIEPTDEDFAQTGLRVALAIRLHRLMTLSIRIVRRKLGTLPEALQQRTQEGLRQLFDL